MTIRMALWILVPLAFLASEGPGPLPVVPPDQAGLDGERLEAIGDAVNAAIDRGQLPGAVVAVVRHGRIGYLQAFGLRSRKPTEMPMTTDTVFDLASLTKPIATATAVMLLAEAGKLRLEDPVARHWPAFGRNGKGGITIEHLLLHTGGLIADNPLADYQGGREQALDRICDLKPLADPGAKFTYSDVGYVVLGLVVEKAGGQPLDGFCRERIFAPLGMAATGFLPSAELAARAAPTEQRGGQWLAGKVHDPRAHLLGGVAGHAGLFSTAADLAVFVQMILNEGEYGGRRLLKPETVRLMTQARPVPGGQRALGWDVATGYSSNRGTGFPAGKSFGHTGFTGTSLWLDPASRTAVIFLSNRVHPDGKGNVNRLRGEVATIVAAARKGG